MVVLLALVLVNGSLTLRQIDARIDEHRQELVQTQDRLAEIRVRVAQLEKSEATSLAKAEAYQQQIAETRGYIRQLDGQISARNDEIAQVTSEIEQTRAKIEARKTDLKRRLVGLYKYGRLLPLETVFSTSTVPELSRRMHYMRFIARADVKIAGELTALKQELSGQQARLMAARAELEELKEERQRQLLSLEAAQASEAEMLKKIRSEQKAKLELEQDLNKAMGNLQSLIAQLEAEREQVAAASDTHYFLLSKGRLPWPVQGKVVANFGSQVHPRYKTTTSNRGIDIESQTGRPAKAIASGRVTYADHFMGYGKLVILDHNGFYSLYANLDEILTRVGAVLNTGEVVGNTKDYLHFEIRREGKPVDPLEWLAPQ